MFWICAAVGIGAHLSFTQLRGFQSEQKVAKPLTTQFVKRQPRLTKPLELKKRPQPKRRQVQREVVAVRARVPREGTTANVQASRVLSSLASPKVRLSRSVYLGLATVEPQALAQAIQGTRDAEDRIDMALDLVDIGALDTGQYQAMVIQNPADKRNITGFLHLARVYSVNTPPDPNVGGLPYADPRALPNLIEAFNQYTDIKADIVGTYTLDSQEVFETPFIMIATHMTFKLSANEMRNLARYLDEGGFLLSDDCFNEFGGASDRALRTMISDALDSRGFRKGIDWTWEILPKDHPIYHCYFDFDGAPRTPWTDMNDPMYTECPEPEGITLHGRLVAVHSSWDFGCAWARHPSMTDFQYCHVLQLGINMLVFAMTQEGSITHHLMESVAY